MKTIASGAIDAMTDGTAIAVGAVKIGCTPPVLVWGGYGSLTLGGETYDGIGDRGLVTLSGSALGDAEQNITLSLSGIEPDVIALFSASSVQRAPCQIWLLTFDGAGLNLLDSQIYTRGKIDSVEVVETIGGTSTIVAQVEPAARGLGRSGQRMRTDADQRLIDAADTGFRVVSFAGQKSLFWGGQKPTSASQLGYTPIPNGGPIGDFNFNGIF